MEVSHQPKVSVVMPVYKGDVYLSEAVESILNQTFPDFEFIIICDDPTDTTRQVLDKYQQSDSRIKIYYQKREGLINSLNRGFSLARGEYIARMDADDVSLPERFAKQVQYLEKHPEIGIVGSFCWLIDENGHQYGILRVPINDLEIRWTSLLGSPFAHPVVMIRRDIIMQYNLFYDDEWKFVEDYELWIRMLEYTHGVNFIDPLLKYRVHFNQTTNKHREIQLMNHDKIAFRTIQRQLPGFNIDIDKVSQLRAMFIGGCESEPILNVQGLALAELYLDMFESFMNCHANASGLKDLQCQVALKVARYFLKFLFKPGWIHLINRLISMEPRLPWLFLKYLPNDIRTRFK